MTITGNVTNQMANYNTGNYDTLFLDGTSTNNVIQGNISDSPNPKFLGTAGRLCAAVRRLYAGLQTGHQHLDARRRAPVLIPEVTHVEGGTLKAGANNVVPTTNLQGIDVTATGTGMTATYDLNGFNQTLNTLGGNNRALNLGGSTSSSLPQIVGAGSTLTVNGNIVYNAANNPLGGLIGVDNLNLGGGNRTVNVGPSTSAGTVFFPDLTISSIVANGAVTKTGAGVLVLTGANTYAGGTTIGGGILAIRGSGTVGSGTVTVAGGTFDMNFSSRSLSNTVLASGAIVNGSLTGTTLLKQGPDVLTLGVPVTGVSTVTVNQGAAGSTANPAKISTLELDFFAAAVTNDVINNTATLTLGGSATGLLGGGAVAIKGVDFVANGQTFAGTAFSGGASALVLTAGVSGTAVLNAGPISRTSVAGTVDVTLPAGAQFASNGVVVGGSPAAGTIVTGMNTAYMTVGGDDWAAYSTDSPGNLVGASVAGPFGASIYTAYAADPTPLPFNGHADITGSFTVPAGSTVDTVRFNTGNNTLTIGAADTLTVAAGGILFGSGSTGATIAGGSIVPGAGQELVVMANKANTQAYPELGHC